MRARRFAQSGNRCRMLTVAIFSGRAGAAGTSCPADQQDRSLDREAFGSDLNNALFRSPRGLAGNAGTVQVPAGDWAQRAAVVVRSCQRIVGTGQASKLIFSSNGYLISNSVRGTDQARTAVGHDGPVMADNVEIGNLSIVFQAAPGRPDIPYHRAIVISGWGDGGPSAYAVTGLQIHDLNIRALSGIALNFADHALISGNTVTGIRDFSDRCAWKANQHSLHPEAGIVLGRGVTNSEVFDNVVQNVGAEGITMDISTTDANPAIWLPGTTPSRATSCAGWAGQE